MKAEFHPHIAAVPERQWDGLKGESPFLRHTFLKTLEDSGAAARETGWAPHHLAVTEKGKLSAALPLYLKSHSFGEYVFDHAWAEAYQEAGGRYYPKLLSAIPFTPVPAAKLLGDKAAALEALRSETERLQVSSAHILFVTKAEVEAAAAKGWLVRHGIQFHWQNRGYKDFDDFLATLTSSKRKTIRKERRKIAGAGLEIQDLAGEEINEEIWDIFYQFYLDTCIKRWGQAYLTRRFFTLLGERMPENILLTLARREGRPIAGALHLKDEKRLYGRYWGASEEHEFLHFELCYYRALDYAIAHGLEAVEAGAQGGHKLLRGYEPVTTRSLHWIANPGFRSAVAEFLQRERREVAHEIRRLHELAPYREEKG